MESEDGAVVCEPGCLVLESDFLLSGELEFGDSEIMGLDREAGECLCAVIYLIHIQLTAC